MQPSTMRLVVVLVAALLSSAVAAQPNRLTSAGLDGDVLRLNLSADPQAVRHFPLADPPRVVIDLFGIDRSAAEMPATAASNPAFEVRTGEHPEFLRVVVDLRSALPSYQVRQSQGLVEVGLGDDTLPPSPAGVLIAESADPGSPSASAPITAPVVDVGVEATPGDELELAATEEALTPGEPTAAPEAEVALADESPVASTSPAPAPLTGGELPNLDNLTTDELLELIEAELEAAGLDQEHSEAELEAAGLDQEHSAEELIEQVEAELDANQRQPAAGSPPPAREPPDPAEWRLRRTPGRLQAAPPDDDGEELPFQYVEEEPAKPPPDDDDNN